MAHHDDDVNDAGAGVLPLTHVCRRGLGVVSPSLGQAQHAGSIPSLQQQAWLESVAQFGSGLTHRLHPHHHHHHPQPQDQVHKVQVGDEGGSKEGLVES
eukprot:scaffold26750_cov21-Tisochrysis_lutea.AAC.2